MEKFYRFVVVRSVLANPYAYTELFISHDISWEIKKYCEMCVLGSGSNLQSDNYTCSKPPVDFKTKVPFWPGQGRTGQAKAELLV